METTDRKLAEEILKQQLDYLNLVATIDDSRYTNLEGHYDVQTGTRIMYDTMYGRIIKAMQAYHEAKLKEELIKYDTWVTKQYWGLNTNCKTMC